MAVKIAGNNYVSPATQKAYKDVLNNGFKVRGATEVIKTEEDIKEIEVISEVINAVPTYTSEDTIDKETEEDMMVDVIKSAIDGIKENQSKTLDMFQTILMEQNKQTAQLLGLLSGNFAPEQNILEAPTAPLTIETPAPEASVSETIITPIATPIAQTVVSPAPVVETIAPAAGNSEMLDLMLSVVADKTGYPAEMLELSMDMEADLGIDSIKRVEIFGAITEQSDKLTDINPSDLTELRTLQEIVDYISSKAGISATTSVATPVAAATEVVSNDLFSAPVVETVTSSEGNSEMLDLMLSVVADKTGYPAEMLELSMDMEADLGIDSIKRVEIFGAITEQSDKLTDINPTDLTELRTLQEIVDYISSKAGISSKKKSLSLA